MRQSLWTSVASAPSTAWLIADGNPGRAASRSLVICSTCKGSLGTIFTWPRGDRVVKFLKRRLGGIDGNRESEQTCDGYVSLVVAGANDRRG